MKSKTILYGLAMAIILQLGVLAASAQTTDYDYSGSETNVTLNPGTFIITAYGADGGRAYIDPGSRPAGVAGVAWGGGGAEMSAEFNFSSPTNLTLLVGVGGGSFFAGNGSAAGGGGGSFVVQGSTPLVVAGGGGGAVANQFLGAVGGGNANVSTNGGAGGGSTGGGGGYSGGGGGGGDSVNRGFGGFPLQGGIGAGGGGGFYTDGGWGSNNTLQGGYNTSQGGSSFEDGGAGGLDNIAYEDAPSGFGGGGGYTLGASYGFPNDFFGGGGGGYSGGGGGGEILPTGECDAGGGGGSFIDSSAVAILAEVAGTNRPEFNASPGEIIITSVPEPASASLIAIGSLLLLRRRVRHSAVESARLGS